MYRAAMATMAMVLTIGQASAGAPEYFSETSKDFGPAPIGPVLTHYYTITNTSKNTVTMGTPRIGCGCVSATLMQGSLAPGQSTTLVAYMDTKKIPNGQRNATKTVTVTVPFLSPVPEEVVCKVTCVGREDLFYSPDSLRFGTLNKGAGGKATMKVTLFGNNAWTVDKIESTGKFVKAEVKALERKGNEVVYEVNATLNPECEVGDWISEVLLSTKGSAGLEQIRIPVTVKVASAFAVTPGELKFGDLAIGSASDRREVMVQGKEPFKVLEVKGTDAKVIVKSVTEGSRTTHMLSVEVTPDVAGKFNRDIQIITDSKEMPTVILPVSATVKK